MLAVLHQLHDRERQIVHMDRLQLLAAVGDHRDQREARKEPEHRRAWAVAAINEGRPHDHPVQVEHREVPIEAQFGFAVGAGVAFTAERRNVDHLADAALSAGLEQRARPFEVDRFEALPGAFPQDAGRIDDRIEAGQPRPPCGHRPIGREVGLDPAQVGVSVQRFATLARAADDFVPGGDQCAGDVAADEAGGAGDEDSHDAVPCLSDIAETQK